MTIRFSRASLSKHCQENIETLFGEKRIKEVDVPGLVADIEKRLLLVWDFQRLYSKKSLAAKKTKQDFSALANAIIGLRPSSKNILREVYYVWNAEPAIGKNHTLQVCKTRLALVGRKTMALYPATLDDLLARLLLTCRLAEAIGMPGQGAPKDRTRIMLTEELISCFEYWTRRKATATPAGVFEVFVGYIFEEVAGERLGMSRRRVIEAALKNRKERELQLKKMKPEATREREAATEMLKNISASRLAAELCP